MLFKEPPKSFKADFEVVGCFLECQGKILTLQRHPQKPRGGRWGLPSGKVDPGEDPFQAIQRELREETMLHFPLEMFKYITTIYVQHPEHSFTYSPYHVSLADQEFPEVILKKDENVAFKWLLPEESAKLENIVEHHDDTVALFYPINR